MRLANTLALLIAGLTSIHGAVLGTYTFTGTGTSGDALVPAASDVTFGSFSRASGLAAVGVDNAFGTMGWSRGINVNLDAYVEFVVTPAAGHSLAVEKVNFSVSRVDVAGGFFGSGPASGGVAIFLGTNLGGDASPVAAQPFAPTTTWSTIEFDFADFNTTVDQGVSVRFYGWDAAPGIFGINWGQLNFDNVEFSATVVPEPTHVALGAFGLIFLAVQVGRTCLARRRNMTRSLPG